MTKLNKEYLGGMMDDIIDTKRYITGNIGSITNALLHSTITDMDKWIQVCKVILEDENKQENDGK